MHENQDKFEVQQRLTEAIAANDLADLQQSYETMELKLEEADMQMAQVHQQLMDEQQLAKDKIDQYQREMQQLMDKIDNMTPRGALLIHQVHGAEVLVNRHEKEIEELLIIVLSCFHSL